MNLTQTAFGPEARHQHRQQVFELLVRKNQRVLSGVVTLVSVSVMVKSVIPVATPDSSLVPSRDSPKSGLSYDNLTESQYCESLAFGRGFLSGGRGMTKNLSDESMRALEWHERLVNELKSLERQGLSDPARRARHRHLDQELRELRASKAYRDGLAPEV